MNTRSLAKTAALFVAAASVGLFYNHLPARAQPRTPRPRVTRPSPSLDAGAPHLDASSDASVVTRSCPSGMVLAEGDWCVNVDQKCLRWLDEPTRLQCAEFEPPHCTSRTRHIAVCMDRYEYPNQPGVSPTVMVSWYEARRLCRAQGKRLCTETEWTFACEGEEGVPYPYGYDRDPDACVVDRSWKQFSPNAMSPRDGAQAKAELDRLWQGMPSGSRAACKSPTGVYDMTGNVDEWTVNETGQPFDSALKGGWWGPIRARCRPATTAHNEGFIYYQIGFRCCADPDPPYRPSGSTPDGGTDGG